MSARSNWIGLFAFQEYTTLEYKLFSPDLKVLDDGSGSITGYASTFGNFDSVGERVVKGAFAASLNDFIKDGFVAVGHNWSTLPIAMPTEAREDDHGLLVTAKFHSTPDGQSARTVIKERMAEGKSVKLSIGYEVLEDEYVAEGRLLKRLKLFEYSYVTVPANNLAAVTGVKHIPAGAGPLAAYVDAAEAAIRACMQEADALGSRRLKEGRVLSDANRKRMAGLKASLEGVLKDLDELLAATDPEREKQAAQALRLRHDSMIAQARLLGVQL